MLSRVTTIWIPDVYSCFRCYLNWTSIQMHLVDTILIPVRFSDDIPVWHHWWLDTLLPFKYQTCLLFILTFHWPSKYRMSLVSKWLKFFSSYPKEAKQLLNGCWLVPPSKCRWNKAQIWENCERYICNLSAAKVAREPFLSGFWMPFEIRTKMSSFRIVEQSTDT